MAGRAVTLQLRITAQRHARKLNDTKRQYERMIRSMENGFGRNPFWMCSRIRCQHNLNARAISSLKGELSGIQSEINQLIAQMQTSIDESRRFVEQLRQEDSAQG